MPIPVTCACGARLKVPDDAAGKKVKCPKCAAILVVSAAEASQKPCPFCAETIQAAAKVCPFCKSDLAPGAARRRERADDESRRDLDMEGHLRAIALWYRIGGVLIAVAGLVAAFALPALMGGKAGAAGAGCVVAVLIGMVGLGAGSYAIGHFLWKYSNAARIVAAVLTILGMLSNVIQVAGPAMGAGRPGQGAADMIGGLIGIGWSIALLWALFNARSAAICTPPYASSVMRTPHLQPSALGSPFFWMPFLIAVIFVAIALMAPATSRPF